MAKPTASGIDPRVARLKALAHPDRLRLLELLDEPERFPDNLVDARAVGVCVNDLAVAAELPQSTASHHIGILEKAGLLMTTRHGQWKYARPDADALDELARDVTRLGGTE